MPTATLEALEQRLTVMEQKLATLEQEVQSASGQRIKDKQTLNRPRKGSLGLFEDEPEMVDEMMALIRAEREKYAQIRAYDIE